MRLINTVIFVILMSASWLWAQDKDRSGTIRGRVLDRANQQPLIGVNVVVENSVLGAVTNLDGGYEITGVAVGSRVIRFSSMGYQTVRVSDVIVRSGRITYVDETLAPATLQMEGVTVRSGLFSKLSDQPGSAVSRSFEEIRRAPGSGGDISRILYSLPCIAKVNDQTNNLIVRGGSPLENGYYIDNIEIPNINHFPTQGASGGPLSLVNVDFIKEVTFNAGGFSVLYGDKLSSVMSIDFREGNRQTFDGQLDLNFAGFGGVVEGPLAHRGSWMFSVRRSYLDLLANKFEIGTTAPPQYGDYQGKLVYSLHPNHKLTLLALWGEDHNNPDREAAQANDMVYYGSQNIYERTTGLNWQALWGKKGFSHLTLSLTSDQYREDFNETGTGLNLTRNHSQEKVIRLRNVNTIQLNRRQQLDFGGDLKQLTGHYHNFYAEHCNSLGDPVEEMALDKKFRSAAAGLFVQYTLKPALRWTMRTGLRYDSFQHTDRNRVSPRLSLTWQISEPTSINASAGLYYQNLPMILLAQDADNLYLRDLKSIHYVLGVSHLLSENVRLTVEAYDKEYKEFPMDPRQPGLFLLDEIFYRYPFFFSHSGSVSQGRAKSRGVEVTVQKKLAERIYGMAGLSFFKSRYRGLDNVWRDRVFDNRFLASFEGGYKPSAAWEFSARWVYAAGAPYTPLDLNKSAQASSEVLDANAINARRYPAYHSLNIRFDRRFHFAEANLIMYLSAWNLYDRKNIAGYFWNEKESRQDALYQWRFLPIFGLEFEF
ncbi:MAG TPA: TonB-dependent receptor [bacterium]|nr:TonB-dependent receptor [bacterium]